MALLDGFKVIPLKEKIDDTFLTISERSLKLNRATAEILGMPEQVQFLINEKRMQIAITPAKPGDEDAVDFTVEEGKVTFTATGFSVYVVVEAPEPIPFSETGRLCENSSRTGRNSGVRLK